VVPDIPLDRDHADAGNVNIPSVKVVALRETVHHTGIDRITIDELDLGEPNTFFEAGRRPNSGHHHQLDEFLAFYREFPSLRFFETIL